VYGTTLDAGIRRDDFYGGKEYFFSGVARPAGNMKFMGSPHFMIAYRKLWKEFLTLFFSTLGIGSICS
jgi:hypothetical protein